MNKTSKQLFNIYNATRKGGNFGGNVYDPYYVCPTMDTMQGGGRIPMFLIEVDNENDN